MRGHILDGQTYANRPQNDVLALVSELILSGGKRAQRDRNNAYAGTFLGLGHAYRPSAACMKAA